MQTIYGNAFRNCSNLTLLHSADKACPIWLHPQAPGLRQGGSQRLSNSYAKDFAARNGIRYVERQPEIIAWLCGADASWELYSDTASCISAQRRSCSKSCCRKRHRLVCLSHRSVVRTPAFSLPDLAFFGCSAW